MNNIIALLTDFGLRDAYIGVMKAVILKISPKINIVDICHSIGPQNVQEGAFLLKTSYKYFKKGAIFIAVVDPGVGSKRNALIVETKNYAFLGPDNGILSIAAREDGIRKIIKIENKKYTLRNVSNTFHGRDIFAPIGACLSKGEKLEHFGKELKKMRRLNIPRPEYVENGALNGEIIYKDAFGNLITNISRNDLNKANLLLKIGQFCEKIKLVKSYNEVKSGSAILIEGSAGYIEISINKGNAARHFKAKLGQKITLR